MMVRTGNHPAAWRDEGPSDGTTGHTGHHGSLASTYQQDTGATAATRRWREKDRLRNRDRELENAKQRARRAAKAIALKALQDASRDL